MSLASLSKSSDLAAHFELPYMKAFLAVRKVFEGEMDLRHCSMVTKIAKK